MNKIGTIVSKENTPNSSEAFILLNENDVKKGQYVKIEVNNGFQIGRIDEIYRLNKYFENMEIIAEVKDALPTKQWECFLAKLTIVGLKTDKLTRNNTVASPGSECFVCDNETLHDFFGFKSNGLSLGRMESHDMDIKIDMDSLLQKHFSVLALSGAGKSYFTNVLIEELLDRDERHGKPAVVLFDTHNEYEVFDKDEKYRKYTQKFKSSEIKIGVPNLNVELISKFVSNISNPQKRELRKILSDMKKENKPFDLDDLRNRIDNEDQKLRSSLLDIIDELKSIGLFGKNDYPNSNKLSQTGKLSIIDMNETLSQKKRQIIVSYISNKLFQERQKKTIPPFLLILEEAHNYAPEKVSKERAISKSIIEKIAREGRKFGACLCLISQRPVHLATTALSQCNSQIILRITNPYDIDHIGKSSEGLTREVLNTIPGLRVGEAIVTGQAVKNPVFFKVREKKVMDSDKSDSLTDACLSFQNNKEKDDKDMEAFM